MAKTIKAPAHMQPLPKKPSGKTPAQPPKAASGVPVVKAGKQPPITLVDQTGIL